MCLYRSCGHPPRIPCLKVLQKGGFMWKTSFFVRVLQWFEASFPKHQETTLKQESPPQSRENKYLWRSCGKPPKKPWALLCPKCVRACLPGFQDTFSRHYTPTLDTMVHIPFKLPGKFGKLPGRSGDFPEAQGNLTPSQRLAKFVSKGWSISRFLSHAQWKFLWVRRGCQTSQRKGLTSPEVLSLWNLTAIQRFPGSFPNFPGSSPNFPGSSRTSPEVRGTSGEVRGLSRSSGEPGSLPATRQICLQHAAPKSRKCRCQFRTTFSDMSAKLCRELRNIYHHHPESKKRESSEGSSGSIHPYGRYGNAGKTSTTISTIAILWPVKAIFGEEGRYGGGRYFYFPCCVHSSGCSCRAVIIKTFISCYRTPRPRKGFRRGLEGLYKGFRGGQPRTPFKTLLNPFKSPSKTLHRPLQRPLQRPLLKPFWNLSGVGGSCSSKWKSWSYQHTSPIEVSKAEKSKNQKSWNNCFWMVCLTICAKHKIITYEKLFWNNYFWKITNFTRNFWKMSFFPGDLESATSRKNYEKYFSGNYFRNNFVSEGMCKIVHLEHKLDHQGAHIQNITAPSWDTHQGAHFQNITAPSWDTTNISFLVVKWWKLSLSPTPPPLISVNLR